MTGQELLIEMLGRDGERIADAIRTRGFVLVPAQPTEKMLDAAWADAHEENALGVWRTMIDAAERRSTETGNQRAAD